MAQSQKKSLDTMPLNDQYSGFEAREIEEMIKADGNEADDEMSKPRKLPRKKSKVMPTTQFHSSKTNTAVVRLSKSLYRFKQHAPSNLDSTDEDSDQDADKKLEIISSRYYRQGSGLVWNGFSD